MAWRDRLQPASFRGVAFEYQSDDLGGIGRRNVVHEYPKRDVPYVEDMGRSVEEISLEAIVIGPDYLTQLDELLKALRAEGPGELVHPFYGRLQVVASGCRVRHTFEEGGLARVSMTFTEAGENQYPAGGSVPQLEIATFRESLLQSAFSRFTDKFGIDGWPDWVSTDSLSAVQEGFTTAQQLYGDFVSGDYAGLLGGMPLPGWVDRAVLDEVAGVVGYAQTAVGKILNGTWPSLLGAPGALATSMLAFVSSFGGGSSARSYRRATGPTAALSLAQAYSAQPRLPAARASSAALTQARGNMAAVQDLFTQAAIAKAAVELAAVEEPVYDDLQGWKGQLVSVIDTEIGRPGQPQPTVEALAELRGAVSRYVLAEAGTASRLVELTPRQVTPAAVLAYDLYDDASRGEEITRRNGLAHPGFVPPTTLKVLNA